MSDVDVSLSAGQATIQYDESLTSFAHLKSAVMAAGYGTGDNDALNLSQSSKGCCCG